MLFRQHVGAILAASLTTLALAGSASADALRSGTFTGENGHAVTGSVTIEGTDGAYSIVLGEDFTLDAAPDPTIAFSDGSGDAPTVILGPVASATGSQSYDLPEGIDPATIQTVWVWCEEFTVSLGVAPLE